MTIVALDNACCECNITVQHYSATLQCDITVQHYNVTGRFTANNGITQISGWAI